MSSSKKKRKTIEWGKTRDLFKKIGAIKGTFHARMDMMKDRTGKELPSKRLKRVGKKTQKNYTEKVLMTWIIMVV